MLTYPDLIIFDARKAVAEFLNTMKAPPFTANDYLLVEEIIMTLSTSFFEFRDFEVALQNHMRFFISLKSSWDYNYPERVDLLLPAVYKLGHDVMDLMIQANAFRSGQFPYLFNQMIDAGALRFELAFELIGGRYHIPDDVEEAPY